MRYIESLVVILVFATASWAGDVPQIKLLRLPNAGVQPQAIVDGAGTLQVIYLAGDPSHADVFLIRSTDGGETFSKPLRVNSQPGSAVSMGTVRGAHLAIGKSGRLHVAWMGSALAEPKSDGKLAPMLYARSTADGVGFEPQQNVIQLHPGLDGGGSIAADDRGNVFIAWHAPTTPGEEQSRRVWLTQSHDDGKTFAPESAISDERGACGCCGIRLFVHGGVLFGLYRSADQKTRRDMTLLRMDLKTGRTTPDIVGKMQSGVCIMSTSALTSNAKLGVVGAWETTGQIFFSPLSAQGQLATSVAAPGRGPNRKHPALATNAAGQTLLVWTEDTGWNKGGAIAWQIYDPAGKPIESASGHAEGLPTWGTAAPFTRADGSFAIIY